MERAVGIIGVQMDLGAVRKGVDMGPSAIRHTGLFSKLIDSGFMVVDAGDILPPIGGSEGSKSLRYSKEIYEANRSLFNSVMNFYDRKLIPLVLGGDHSIAAGSISASSEFFNDIGIIWIDAHADFNDESITPSGNMHGMPLSAVCGCGPDSMVEFCKKRVSPKHVAIIGARSIDPEEKIKLEENKVTVYSISDIHIMGIQTVMEEALEIAGSETQGIHVSFDMDALDPSEAPGVGTPVANGLSQREAFIICELLHKSNRVIAMDFVETNPLLDIQNKTGTLASNLILSCLGCTNFSK